jgi:inositol-1,4,5-trisphosphate 5-phosphatase
VHWKLAFLLLLIVLVLSTAQHIVGDMEVQEVTGEAGRQIVYRKSHGDRTPVLTVMRKSFVLAEDDTFTKKYMELRKFDKESEHFSMLSEVEIAFQPSYPFSEDVQQGRKYMQKRCPAWCDRILMNTEALKFVEESPIEPEYSIMGKEVSVGDHKPVYLLFDLQEATVSNR